MTNSETLTQPTTQVSERPAYREPWTHGAKAYIEADSFDAALYGLRRKRNSKMVHMSNSGEAGELPCILCKRPLKDLPDDSKSGVSHSGNQADRKPDAFSTWNYDPKRKRMVGGRHYDCSWSLIFTAIARMH